MSEPNVGKASEALFHFGQAIGVPAEVWSERESLTKIDYADDELSSEVAQALSLAQLTPLAEACGEALRCRFLLQDLPVLDVRPGLDNAALATFRQKVKRSPTVRLDLRLDKPRLLQEWAGAIAGCRLFLYLFPAALHKLLSGSLPLLEQRLWGKKAGQKAVLLVPGHGMWLDGPCLAVLGGERVLDPANWRDEVAQQLPDAERLQKMYDTCRQRLNWEQKWLSHLTPLHLEVSGQAGPADAIANALRVHWANAIILYTADRTVEAEDGSGWSSAYIGATRKVEVPLGDPGTRLDEPAAAGVETLGEMLEWAYEPQWASDRLDLTQIGVIEALHSAPVEERYTLLLRNAATVFQGLKWHWMAWIEKKVDAYVEQVGVLEDYIHTTVQAFDDQVSGMIKHLSETMLAAVGAFLGSFIAALFKDQFNPAIFQLGLWVYALYVLLFPLGYGLLHQGMRYRALSHHFAAQRQRFEQRLGGEKVQAIVEQPLASVQGRFLFWFAATLVAYAAVIGLALLAAERVPPLVQASLR
jgi:hypothetical protein